MLNDNTILMYNKYYTKNSLFPMIFLIFQMIFPLFITNIGPAYNKPNKSFSS